MKQLKISLPDDFRAKLDATSQASGRSLADEIRTRVERTFDEDAVDKDKPTADLLDAIESLVTLVSIQTGRSWHESATAHRSLRYAIMARLSRLRPEGEPNAAHDAAHRPVQLIASDDPEAIGLGLEALNYHSPSADDPRVRAAIEISTDEMRKIHERQKP